MKRRVLHRALLIAGMMALILAIGTAGFTILEGWSLFDSFYMTLITITTVGYGEIHPLDTAGRVFNSVLIIFGVSALFIAFGAFTQTIIELELQERFGRRRRERLIEHLKDHFIVCGFGRVGRNASYEFQRAGVDFIVVDRSQDRVARAGEAGMLAMAADATNDDDLKRAGVLRAKGLIAALPSDAENLFIILSAKTLNPNLLVVTRASEEQAEEKLRRAGADTVYAPYTIAGRRLANSLLRPHVVQFIDFATSNVGPEIMMEQMRVEAGTKFISATLASMLSANRLNVILLAIRHASGEMIFNPAPDSRISAGDFLIVLGERPSLKKLEQALAGS